MKNVLILVPKESALGGISNYYEILHKYFSKNIIYQYRGSRNYPFRKSPFYETIRILDDYIKFIYLNIVLKIKLVQTTTYFGKNAVFRDSIFILLAKLMRKKTVVFYHGWDSKLSARYLDNAFFKKIYFNIDAAVVLSKLQKKILIEKGFKLPIFIESTAVDDQYLTKVKCKQLIMKYENLSHDGQIVLLFLARIEKEKGVFELLEAYEILKKQYEDVKLVIAGDGKAIKSVKRFIRKYNLKDVFLPGFVRNFVKEYHYMKSHIYILPSYAEGMPNSVLEAMSFGMPVLTTPVGGLVDFFEDNKNGLFIKIKSSVSIKEKVETLIRDKSLMKEMAVRNYMYARDNFKASVVAKRNEVIFKKILSSK